MCHSDASQWHQAALDELAAQRNNGTWAWWRELQTIESLDPSGYSSWSTMAAKGYNQCPGFDYIEISAPTACMAFIHIILALAAIQGLHLCFVDVSNAYLNGKMDCDIYMELPEGFAEGNWKESVYVTLTMVVARTLDALLVLMWPRWVLVLFLGAPSFKDLLSNLPLK